MADRITNSESPRKSKLGANHNWARIKKNRPRFPLNGWSSTLLPKLLTELLPIAAKRPLLEWF
jgi:hypothetical protein